MWGEKMKISVEDLQKEWVCGTEERGHVQADIWDRRAGEFDRKPIPGRDDPFLRYLWEKAKPDPSMAVLDVGCGAGQYSIALAEAAGKITGTDISPEMIDFARRKAEEMKLSNVEFIVSDWAAEGTDISSRQTAFDIVFAHMTPAVCDYRTLEAMDRCSKEHCFLVKPARRRATVLDGAFARIGLDVRSKEEDETILNAFSYLWLKGYSPEVTVRHENHTAKRSEEETAEWCIGRAALHRRLTSKEKEDIRLYVASISEGGRTEEIVDTVIVTMYWNKHEIGGYDG